MFKMLRQLKVFLFGRKVGALQQEDGRLRFAYDPAWLAAPKSVPLSQSLPLREEPFDDKAARPFFAGLLPEGDLRVRLAKILQVSRQNDFALLDGLGGECAGAVSLLETLPKRPMLVGEAGLRLSLVGVQDKLPVLAEEGQGKSE